MKFNEFDYSRPEIDTLKVKFNDFSAEFSNAKNFESQREAFQKINLLLQEFTSMYNLCHIRHTINTKDKFYEEENDYFDKNNPLFKAIKIEFYKILLKSPFKQELKQTFGEQLFRIAEMNLKTFEPKILEYLQKENKLSSDYVKVKATAQLNFKGKEYNLASITPLELDKDRQTRKDANACKWAFFEKHANEIESIFDKQVKLRNEIAKTLGYKNFVELGYTRMLRSDYTAEQVAQFRESVRKYIVPIANQLYERQRKRIGTDSFYNFDEGFRFASGNPSPKGTADWIIENAGVMYNELSAETGQFFNFMRQNELMDLVNKEGKATGGYCTFIRKYNAPYIFSNFNGTSGDIDVLTHEAGHAFQVFSSKDIPVNEYIWPTYEACEIHSMSMEFFTWPWMELFFKEDTDKYKFSHLSAAIKFIPYGVAIDEFQHFVYENPDVSPAERNAVWKALEEKYMPHRKYDNNAYLEAGGFWQKQSHVFTSPFYYIDYALAQICAFQFWSLDRKNHEEAWRNYVELCRAGGSKSFLELVELAKLRSPFEEDCIRDVLAEITQWFEGVDDSSF